MAQLPMNQAVLSSKGDFTIFRFGTHTIRFRQEEEEYIDLVPILKNLYFDPDQALTPIEKVSIQYEQ